MEKITTYDSSKGCITNFMHNILDIYLKNYYTRTILANRYGLILPNSSRTEGEKHSHMIKASELELNNVSSETEQEMSLHFSNVSSEIQNIIRNKLPKLKQLFIKKVFYEQLNPKEAEVEINTELLRVKQYYQLHPLEHICEKTPIIKKEFYTVVIKTNKNPDYVYNKLKIRSGFYYKDKIMVELKTHLNNVGIRKF
jgi:hypothetical protein